MTHSGGKSHTNVGDRGQLYEVSYLDGRGERRVLGWADHFDGVRAMCVMVRKHPTWRYARIYDRRGQKMVALEDVPCA